MRYHGGCTTRARRIPEGVGCILLFLSGLGVLSGGWGQSARAFDPLNGDYTRADVRDVRVLSYNHNQNFIHDSSADDEFERILTTIDPDIICFQEFGSSVSTSQVANRLNSILPVAGGGWDVHFGLLGGIRTVLASRYPLSMTRVDTIPPSSTRGVTIALADLPDADYGRDVYLLGVHLKCCGDPGGSEDASRQDSADAIANWLGDARGVARPSGDNVSLPADVPMICLGDFNLVGGPQPEDTLVTGDIQDEGGYGPGVAGDWDGSSLTDLGPLDPFTGDDFTWQGNANFPPSRLDRFFYTDSTTEVANSFVLNTATMSPSALAAAGLQADDTSPGQTSDHLPIVMDIRFEGLPECMVDGDCSDGVYCNGVEQCVDGRCASGVPVDCDDGLGCTADFCDEAGSTCIQVPEDGLCDDGQFCNGAEVCSAGAGCLAGTPPCPTAACDESGDACVTDVPASGAWGWLVMLLLVLVCGTVIACGGPRVNAT